MNKNIIDIFIKKHGGTIKAAKYLGVRRETLWRWKQENVKVPKSAVMIMQGKVK